MWYIFVSLAFALPNHLNPHHQPRFSTSLLPTKSIDLHVPKNWVLFNNGEPSPMDFEQGYLGDCFFIQTLSALAFANPGVIKRNIKKKVEGGYKYFLITFYNPITLQEIDIAVDASYPSDKELSQNMVISRKAKVKKGQSKSKHLIIWPILYEKAFAKLNDYFKTSIIASPIQHVKNFKLETFLELSMHHWLNGFRRGYSSLELGGFCVGVYISILTGNPYVHYPLSSKNTAFTRKLNALKFFGAQHPNLLKTAVSSVQLIKDPYRKKILELHDRNSIDCYNAGHGNELFIVVHPVRNVDIHSGTVSIYCDHEQALLKIPWIPFLQLFDHFYMETSSELSNNDILVFSFNLLREPLFQPKQISFSDWINIDLKMKSIDVQSINISYDPLLQTVLDSVNHHFPDLLNEIVVKTSETTLNVYLNGLQYIGKLAALERHKVGVDLQILRANHLFPWSDTHFPVKDIWEKYNPNHIWTLGFLKATYKLLDHLEWSGVYSNHHPSDLNRMMELLYMILPVGVELGSTTQIAQALNYKIFALISKEGKSLSVESQSENHIVTNSQTFQMYEIKSNDYSIVYCTNC